ncbi:PREDICTED: uncharacterized protein LOC104766830 [Camelina sativa]|uniref:Uncharacterized protein LOC104766830 n=1 Tax=Camelina sativa TaxID=90675 RepID=A0ABM1RDR0_CAMSA|nr:PREDICTED: uncharacterized protein LOC104766830 [Camelina sativa]
MNSKEKQEERSHGKIETEPVCTDKECEDAESVKFQEKIKGQSIRCVTEGVKDLTQYHESQGDKQKLQTCNKTKRQEIMNCLPKHIQEGESGKGHKKKQQFLKSNFKNQQGSNPKERIKKKVCKPVEHQVNRQNSENKATIHDAAKVEKEKSVYSITVKRESVLIDQKFDEVSQKAENIKDVIKVEDQRSATIEDQEIEAKEMEATIQKIEKHKSVFNKDTGQRKGSLTKREKKLVREVISMDVNKGHVKQKSDLRKAHETVGANMDNNNSCQIQAITKNTKCSEKQQQIERGKIQLTLKSGDNKDFRQRESQVFDSRKSSFHMP